MKFTIEVEAEQCETPAEFEAVSQAAVQRMLGMGGYVDGSTNYWQVTAIATPSYRKPKVLGRIEFGGGS